MKKLISLIIFVVLLAWSWNLIHSESAVGHETHVGIQSQLSEIIQQSLQKHRPEAEDFKLVRWDPLESTCRHASLSIL